MRVHLATFGDDRVDQPVGAFRQHAATDRVGAHVLTDSPQQADLVLFTQCHMLEPDWRLERIRRHPLMRAFRDKVLVYHEADLPWCALPGVYVNMPASAFVGAHQRPFGYFVDDPAPLAPLHDRDLLFSFIGSPTARCRRPLLRLSHPDAIVEEVRGFRFWDPASRDFAQRRERFASTLARSRFVLCPRGTGTSSIRLYEVLAAGAVPVIVADDWVAPAGPRWDHFSLRWPEGVTAGLIERLQARDADWPQLSRAARAAYEDHFGPASYFHGVVERCEQLLRTGSPAAFPARGIVDRRFAEIAALHVAGRARHAARGLRRRVRGGGYAVSR